MNCLFLRAFCAAVSWPDEEGWVSLIGADLQGKSSKKQAIRVLIRSSRANRPQFSIKNQWFAGGRI
jgi:predicted ATP-dependent endonuclease of OLD family